MKVHFRTVMLQFGFFNLLQSFSEVFINHSSVCFTRCSALMLCCKMCAQACQLIRTSLFCGCSTGLRLATLGRFNCHCFLFLPRHSKFKFKTVKFQRQKGQSLFQYPIYSIESCTIPNSNNIILDFDTVTFFSIYLCVISSK